MVKQNVGHNGIRCYEDITFEQLFMQTLELLRSRNLFYQRNPGSTEWPRSQR